MATFCFSGPVVLNQGGDFSSLGDMWQSVSGDIFGHRNGGREMLLASSG